MLLRLGAWTNAVVHSGEIGGAQHGRGVLRQQARLELLSLPAAAPDADGRFAHADGEQYPHEILNGERIDRAAPVEKDGGEGDLAGLVL